MITLSETALQELESFFAEREKTPIRIYLAAGGWQGPRLALALDEPSSEDDTQDINGLTFCIAKDLAAQTGDITIDLTYMGFVVDSANPLGNQGGGGCGGCSSGSCSI